MLASTSQKHCDPLARIWKRGATRLALKVRRDCIRGHCAGNQVLDP
jgi:hypothetical protein